MGENERFFFFFFLIDKTNFLNHYENQHTLRHMVQNTIRIKRIARGNTLNHVFYFEIRIFIKKMFLLYIEEINKTKQHNEKLIPLLQTLKILLKIGYMMR